VLRQVGSIPKDLDHLDTLHWRSTRAGRRGPQRDAQGRIDALRATLGTALRTTGQAPTLGLREAGPIPADSGITARGRGAGAASKGRVDRGVRSGEREVG